MEKQRERERNGESNRTQNEHRNSPSFPRTSAGSRQSIVPPSAKERNRPDVLANRGASAPRKTLPTLQNSLPPLSHKFYRLGYTTTSSSTSVNLRSAREEGFAAGENFFSNSVFCESRNSSTPPPQTFPERSLRIYRVPHTTSSSTSPSTRISAERFAGGKANFSNAVARQ